MLQKCCVHSQCSIICYCNPLSVQYSCSIDQSIPYNKVFPVNYFLLRMKYDKTVGCRLYMQKKKLYNLVDILILLHDIVVK